MFKVMLMMWSAIKEIFPGIRRFTAYLNTASSGLLPTTSFDEILRVTRMIEHFEAPINSVDFMDREILEPTLKEAAKIIGSHKDEVTISIQTTDGLKKVLYALKPKKDKKNIVSFDMEFPTISTLIKSYAKKHHLEIRVVKNVNGTYPIEYVEKYIDDSTFAVIGSSVQWITGFMIDLRELGKVVHDHEGFLIVDAVQHVGAVKIDVKRLGIDILSAGGEKWLLNPSIGSGILFVSKEIQEHLEPLLGLLNMTSPLGVWDPWWADFKKDPWDDLKPRADARLLDFGGGPPYLIAAALYGALKLMNNVGMDKITRNNISLKRFLVDRIYEVGLELIGHSEDEGLWSPIATIKTGLGFEEEGKLCESLKNEGIYVSHRGLLGIHGIRVSPHLYNDKEDVEIFMEEFFRLL